MVRDSDVHHGIPPSLEGQFEGVCCPSILGVGCALTYLRPSSTIKAPRPVRTESTAVPPFERAP